MRIRLDHLDRLARPLIAFACCLLMAGLALSTAEAMAAPSGPIGQAWPLPPGKPPTPDLPAIQAVTVTANLPLSDTAPGSATSRQVFFNNAAAGNLTITLQISGTVPITVGAGAAFSGGARETVVSSAPWAGDIAYSVAPSDGNQAVGITITNSTQFTAAFSLALVRDITPPTGSSLVISGGAETVATSTVSLTLSSTDSISGVGEMCVSNDESCPGWEPFATEKAWSLPAPDGPKTVYAWFRDHVQNATTAVTNTVGLEVQALRTVITTPSAACVPFLVSWGGALDSYTISYTKSSTPGIWIPWLSVPVAGSQSFTTAIPGLDYTFRARAKISQFSWNTSATKTTHVLSCTYLPLVMRQVPPVGTIVVNGGDSFTSWTSATLSLNVGPVQAGAEMRIRNDDEAWPLTWEAFAPQKLWTLSPANGRRVVHAQFRDAQGVESAAVQDSILLFQNGDFAAGPDAWTMSQSPLPVSIVTSVGDTPVVGNAVLLGSTNAYPCDGVPVGFASTSQPLQVPAGAPITLTFDYIIHSLDASPSGTYDRFEVYVNDTVVFADGNLVNQGLSCSNWWRVPGPDNQRGGRTSGWAAGKVSLAGYAGQVTISFRNYNRVDGWYNTYTYVDNVALE